MRMAEAPLPPRLPGRRSRIFLSWFARISLGLTAVGLLLLLVVPLFIDWNAFKPGIVAAARAATGREVEIGRIEVTFLPLPTAAVSGFRLANPDGMEPRWMANVPEARATLHLLPLLDRRLIIDEVHLQKPEVHLLVDSDGGANWQLGNAGTPRAEPAGSNAGSPFDFVSMKGLSIEGGQVTFHDRTTDQQITAAGLDLDGEVDAEGSDPEALLENLEARVQLALASTEASDLPITHLQETRASVVLPAGGANAKIDLQTDASGRGGNQATPIRLRGEVGRPETLLAGTGAYPLALEGRIGDVHAKLTGEIADPLKNPRPHGTLELEGPSTGALASLLDLEVRDPGPFHIKARAEVKDDQQIVLHAFHAKLAGFEASASGEISDADTADPKPAFEIDLEGETLAGLAPWLGPGAPDLGPVSLKAKVSTAGQQLTIQDLEAEVAGSDLEGHLAVRFGGPRPHVSGALESRFVDLTKLLGSQAQAREQAGQRSARPRGPIFTDQPLPLDLLLLVDADLALDIDELRGEDDLELRRTSLKLGLESGRLSIDPVFSELAGGGLKGTLALDASRRPVSLEGALDVENLQVGELLTDLGAIALGDSVALASAQLQATGNSPHQLASSLDGQLFVSAKGGRIELGALRILVAGLGDIIRPLFGERDTIDINCFVNSFDVADGVMTSNVQLLSTTAFAVAGAGQIDLGREELDFYLKTETRGASLADFAVPFRVRGPITDPKAHPDPAGTLFTAAKVAGMFLDPIAMAGMLATSGRSDRAACEQALATAQQGGSAESRKNAIERAMEGLGQGLRGLLGNQNPQP